MQSLIKPLERVVEVGEFFVRTPTVRVLSITTTGMLRNAVLAHLQASEMLTTCDAPFVILEAPTEPDDDGWQLRVEEMEDTWEGFRKTAPELLLPPLPKPSASGLAGFAQSTQAAMRACRGPVKGIVIVLAPVWITDVVRWKEDLRVLLTARALSDVRIVIVECDSEHGRETLTDLELTTEHVNARTEEQNVTSDLRAQLDAMRTAPANATGARLTGAAGPRVAPPPRLHDARKPSAEEIADAAQQSGIASANLDAGAMHQVAILQRAAIVAVREGRLVEAIHLQRETMELCERLSLVRESILHRLVLGSFALQAGELKQARQVYLQAEEAATRHQLPLFRIQSRMAVASIENLLKQRFDAAQSYAEAGNLASQEGQLILAIESYRLAGQCLLPEHPEQAVLAFQRALDVANAAPDQARASTVPEAARDLAKVCREHGLHAQATSLEAQAVAYENAALGRPA